MQRAAVPPSSRESSTAGPNPVTTPCHLAQEAADAAAQEAVADAAQVAALERLTDPALIDGWCGSMADDLSELIESDWHDGWEEQSEQFGGVMHEVQFMLATAGVAHFSGRHGLALRACAALGKGAGAREMGSSGAACLCCAGLSWYALSPAYLQQPTSGWAMQHFAWPLSLRTAGLSKICKAYRSSRNDIKEELCGPACEDLGFPMDPPSGLPQMLPAGERRALVWARVQAWVPGRQRRRCSMRQVLPTMHTARLQLLAPSNTERTPLLLQLWWRRAR